MIPWLSPDLIILDHQSDVDKMMVILSDTSKFLRLGPADNFDHTTFTETKFQRKLVELIKNLPKTHKEGVPLRPILSMAGSSQHRVAKWLDWILQPVLIH